MLILAQAAELDRWVADLDAAEVELRERAEKRLRESGEAARAALEAKAREAGEAGIRAQRILRWIDFAALLPPVAHARPDVGGDLLHGSPEDRQKVVWEKLPKLLGLYAPPAGFLRRLLDDPDESLRVRAAAGLRHDADGRATAIVLRFLHEWDRPEYAPLRGDNFGSRVSDAGGRIAHWGRARPEDILPLLSSRTSQVREEGVDILRRMRHWDAAPQVRRLLQDGHSNVVCKSIYFLEEAGRLGPPEDYLEIVRNRSDWCATYAARALERLGFRAAAPELARLACRKDPDATVAGALLQTASRLDPEAAEPEALEIVRNTVRDKHLNRYAPITAALEALSRTGKEAHWPLILAGIRRLADDEYRLSLWLIEYDPSGFNQALALMVPAERYGDVLDLCKVRHEYSFYVSLHARPDNLNTLGWSLAERIEGPAFTAACLERVLDPEIPEEARTAAAQALGIRKKTPADVEAVLAASRDPAVPDAVRCALLESLPWGDRGPLRERLLAFAQEGLNERGAPLREKLLKTLWFHPDPEARVVVLRLLEADERMPFPARGYSHWQDLPEGEAIDRLVERRLRSRDPAVRVSTLHQLEGFCHRALPAIRELLLSECVQTRSAAIEACRHGPRPELLPSLRKLARDEREPGVLAGALEALHRLRDRPGLEAALGRDLKPGSAEDLARVRFILDLGTPSELLALEGRLRQFPPDLLRAALPALARADAEAARRFLLWALVHEHAFVRAGAAEAIGAAKLEDHFRPLAAMARTEAAEPMAAALKSLVAFERSRWIPVFREVLLAGGHETAFDVIQDRGVPELASELLGIVREGDYEGGKAAQALDASLRASLRARWAGVKITGPPWTLESIARTLEREGLAVRLSAEISGEGAEPLEFYSGLKNTALGWVSGQMMLKDKHPRRFLTAVSEPDGVRFMTLPEAAAYWEKAR